MSDLLRVVACGSVDDGKSTLIGRLLAATGSVAADHLEEAARERRPGSLLPAGQIDYSLLTDGLQSERSQGITIDVAYRHLRLPDGRRALLADAPGHEQYTANMAVAASTADLALLVVDASRGCRPQTWAHLGICALMQVKGVYVAVNKMDAVHHDQQVFDAVCREVGAAALRLGLLDVVFVPVSAATGAGVTAPSLEMPWYAGPPLLDAVVAWRPSAASDLLGEVRLPVQAVLRGVDGQRLLVGTLLGGHVAVGDTLRVARSGAAFTVAALHGPSGVLHVAAPGTPVLVVPHDDVDVDRGDVVVPADTTAVVADRWSVDLVWFSDEPLARGRSYLVRCGPQSVTATVTAIRYRRDPDTGFTRATRTLDKGTTGRVELATDAPVLLDAYETSRDGGGVLLVDRVTADTVGAGLVRFALRRGTTLTPYGFELDRPARERLLGQRGRVLWLTGVPASGKSTLADQLDRRLYGMGVHCAVLDGDSLRGGLNADLGFTPEDRAENVRRAAAVARLMLDAGLVVVVALVSPYRNDRLRAQEIVGADDFREVWVDTPLDVCAERDPKGLYALAARGDLPNLTGSPGQEYEPPEHPALVLDGTADVRQSVERLVALLSDDG